MLWRKTNQYQIIGALEFPDVIKFLLYKRKELEITTGFFMLQVS
jgi:hypothetical protein